MGDWKSKLPSLSEVGSIAKKLAADIKTSVTEIVKDYKDKHPHVPDEVTPKPDAPAEPLNKEPVDKSGLSPKEIMPEKPAEDIETPAVVKPSEEKAIKTEPTPVDEPKHEDDAKKE